MMKWITQFILILGVWFILVWSFETPDVIAGVLIAAFLSLLLNSIFEKEATYLLHPVRLFWMIVYIPVFFYHMIVANFDVAYRVINPGLPIKPGIVKVKTKLKTDMGKMFLANSITLTPGTLTVDVEDDVLYIHWINVQTDDVKKATEIIVGKFEKYLVRIFG
jgi:multicomponent Na+:H+ antiporter subunit E